MMSVLKTVGKGILYILGLPFFLLALVGMGIVGIFGLIFMFFKSIILFFTGRSLDDALPEDKLAKQIKETRAAQMEQPAFANNPYAQPQAAPQQQYQPQPQPQPQQMTIEEAVFGPQQQEHIPFEDEIKDEPVEEERSSDEIFESIFGNEHKEDDYTSVNIETEKADDEPIGEYVPNKSNQRIVADDSEEEDNSATNIYFGGDDD